MAHPELAQKFGMTIGKTFRFGRIAEHSWKQFAADLSIRLELLYSFTEEACAAVAPAVEPLAAQHERQYGASPIYERLVRIVRDGLKRIMGLAEREETAG